MLNKWMRGWTFSNRPHCAQKTRGSGRARVQCSYCPMMTCYAIEFPVTACAAGSIISSYRGNGSPEWCINVPTVTQQVRKHNQTCLTSVLRLSPLSCSRALPQRLWLLLIFEGLHPPRKFRRAPNSTGREHHRMCAQAAHMLLICYPHSFF